MYIPDLTSMKSMPMLRRLPAMMILLASVAGCDRVGDLDVPAARSAPDLGAASAPGDSRQEQAPVGDLRGDSTPDHGTAPSERDDAGSGSSASIGDGSGAGVAARADSIESSAARPSGRPEAHPAEQHADAGSGRKAATAEREHREASESRAPSLISPELTSGDRIYPSIHPIAERDGRPTIRQGKASAAHRARPVQAAC